MKPVLISLLFGLLASPAVAERISCTLSAPCKSLIPCSPDVDLYFSIDHNQFVDPVHVNDPPRNKVTLVDLGGVRFSAEPLVIGDTRGFWADDAAMGQRIFTMQADGSGIYNEPASSLRLSGRCEVVQ